MIKLKKLFAVIFVLLCIALVAYSAIKPPPARFPSGVTTAERGDPLDQFMYPDPTKAFVFFDDFIGSASENWILDQGDAAATGSYIASVSNDGHVSLFFQTANEDNNSVSARLGVGNIANGTAVVTKPITMEAGKRAWFASRFHVEMAVINYASTTSGLSEANKESEIFVGLSDPTGHPVYSHSTIGFFKNDGDADVDFQTRNSSLDASTGGVAAVTEVFSSSSDRAYWNELAWYYDGASTFHVYANGTKVAAGTTTYMPTEALTAKVGIRNGSAHDTQLYVDYILLAQER